LLKETFLLLKQKGYSVGNIDASIVLQKPKLKNIIPEMQKILSQILELDTEDLSIKATTTEKLGFVGSEEGVSAYAVALIEKRN